MELRKKGYKYLKLSLWIMLLFISGLSIPITYAASQQNKMIYGVTVDDISTHFPELVSSLKALPYKPTVRMVFDPQMPPSYYTPAAKTLHKSTYIMGELLDSSSVKQYSVSVFK